MFLTQFAQTHDKYSQMPEASVEYLETGSHIKESELDDVVEEQCMND